MPVKRKRTSEKKTASGRPTKKRGLAKAIRTAIAANNKKFMEVKQAVASVTDGTQIQHNNFAVLDTNPLSTTQGVTAPNNSFQLNRIGDKINVKGLKLHMMIELNERYSDVTFRLLVVKCAKGDTPSIATLFNGISNNKMIDTINYERYSILAQKYFKITAPNIASNGVASGGLMTGGGTFDMLNGQQTLLSRATKMVKLWIPGTKFAKGGVIQYESGSSQVKFHDYKVLLFAYSNFAHTSNIAFEVGRVNDYVNRLIFTDA